MDGRASTMIAVAAAAVVGLAACSGDDATVPGPGGGPRTTMSTEQGAGEQNAADVMFVTMMIPHHEQAIEMSEVVLAADGVDERVADLARRIAAAQGPEIDLMRGWLEEWGSPMGASGGMDDMGGMGGMDHGGSMAGMVSEADMQALRDAEGPEASRLFLEHMVEHHEGAIEMAQDELDDGRSPQALELARSIIETQQAEIAEMEELLAGR